MLLNDGLCVKAICWDCTSVYFNLQWSKDYNGSIRSQTFFCTKKKFWQDLITCTQQFSLIPSKTRTNWKTDKLAGSDLTFHVIWHFMSFDTSCHLTFHVIWHFMSFDISCHLTFHVIWHFMSFDISSHLTFHVIWHFMSFDISCYLTFHVIWHFTWCDFSHHS